MLTTIIRCNPGKNRGALRGYTITQVRDGLRTDTDIIARTGRAAIEAFRAMTERTAQREVAA